MVPRGGIIEIVSCPNYFAEVVEWFGWTLMTWSWAGLGFFCCKFANLGKIIQSDGDVVTLLRFSSETEGHGWKPNMYNNFIFCNFGAFYMCMYMDGYM